MAHAKMYVVIPKLKLTTYSQIFAFLTYFALMSLTIICPKKFSQESVDHLSAIQPPEAQSI